MSTAMTLKSGGVLHSEVTFVPITGANVLDLGIDPSNINPDWLDIEVTPLGPSVTNASYTSISGDYTQITIAVTQTGSDQITVEAVQNHSITR